MKLPKLIRSIAAAVVVVGTLAGALFQKKKRTDDDDEPDDDDEDEEDIFDEEEDDDDDEDEDFDNDNDEPSEETPIIQEQPTIPEEPQPQRSNEVIMKQDQPVQELPANTPQEFKDLHELLVYRVKQLLNEEGKYNKPQLDKWSEPLRSFIKKKFDDHLDSAFLLVTALAPYVIPELFENVLKQLCTKEKDQNEWPIIGGIHGRNFRGFLPTGQTFLFLMDNDDLARRLTLQSLFDADKIFFKTKIVWLEDLPDGEPSFHGRLIMSQDYVDYFLFNTFKPPHFGPGFPAVKIETNLQWKDLVVSKEVRDQINDIKNWIRNNERLVTEWGMGDRFRKGYRALFYGPSGTGKTLAASLLGKYALADDTISNECTGETTPPPKGKDVYKVDLSMIVSKYIGETEKNLELLFARAEDKGWILFFDEADALFGKRTSVRDAHDRYANQEVSYLLQRIETYNGAVILASNFKHNIDEAFIRRFDSVIQFTMPNADERVKIWQRIFPRDVLFVEKEYDFACHQKPVSFDIYPRIKHYELSGGNILNVVHYACLKGIAKMPGKVIYLQDVLDGIRKETIKEGKPFVA